jgi:hypothetical protein
VSIQPVSLPQILAALQMVDRWINDRAAELTARFPDEAAEIEEIRVKLQVATDSIETLTNLAGYLDAIAAGGETDPDDADLA